MISNAQIRAARALLGLGIDELSAASGVSASTIREIEAADNSRLDGTEAVALKTALDRLGVAFLSPGDCCDGGEGLRLKARQETSEGIRPENLNATNDD
ncbi:helix-turn-helix transcriptional regulator [Rhizobium sp. RU36D]|uniref:helix-turn-helix domain-containing protein n=1 Tax=Rhizobium sp. RU36D TaxID=1907415 RepID=UPI0009D85D79|nr:helix-turn-helix transcriptional regulator [Rhizobium sp. RU36D]SMD08694.1 hypothetical protein SAMN05880593_12050 [Rhizobium sp. RU36D]